jgi:hypothetical protein
MKECWALSKSFSTLRWSYTSFFLKYLSKTYPPRKTVL